MLPADALQTLRDLFDGALQEYASLANHTTARAGGLAEALLTVNSAGELEQAALRLWELEVPFFVLGSGSNVLVSDGGFHGVVILNRARAVQIDDQDEPPSVWAESGANLGAIARQVALRGLGGLEWAATIPGTLGGAVYGNAGAYGGDMSHNLMVADILHPHGIEAWTAGQMKYAYRSSALKSSRSLSGAPSSVILSARLKLEPSDRESVQARMEANGQHRRSTQPPGASMGSMFKNPPGDYAGRLIEAAGLKGARVGDAQISPVHANFFINHGRATAADVGRLIAMARQTVQEKLGVLLELEIELLGDWPEVQNYASGENSNT